MKKPEPGKVALITGCSSGIGKAIAVDLGSSGWTVIATGRKPEALSNIGATLTLKLDVTDSVSVHSAFETVRDKFGGIDLLINNAGFGSEAAIEELSDEALHGMLDTNLFGVLRCMRAAIPEMRERGSGTIINIGSIAGRWAAPFGGGYAASKSALASLTEAARQELATFGINVSLVEPGPIATEFKHRLDALSSAVRADRTSPYYAAYQLRDAYMASVRTSDPGPELVATTVRILLGAKIPKARYLVASDPALKLLLKLPQNIRDSLFASSIAAFSKSKRNKEA